MNNEIKINFLDYLVIFVKHKKFLIGYTFLSMVIFYLLIFFFVEEKYDSEATVIPSQDNSITGIASMLGDLGGLPFGLGASSNPEIGLYNTIITSRTTIENVISKFNLWDVYNLDPKIPKEVKKARERLLENISGEETDDGAYTIGIRTPDSVLSANIANYLLEYLNSKIIELKVDKSQKNRIFLEGRLHDVRSKLTNSEDSLKIFQSETGMLIPEEQIKSLLSAYSLLEKDLVTKQLQKEVLEKIYDKNSPKLKSIQFEVDIFEKKLNEIKTFGKDNSIFIPYASIPEYSIKYYRLYREIEINNAILQFILPLYEQARIEEQKDIPVMQVIDYAIPAEIKSFPRRSIFALVFGFGVFILLFGIKVFKENKNIVNSDKYAYVIDNLFKWRIKNDSSI
jgi:uncharacterized protein involved in exopolysaccharide biosynthesis